MAKEPAKVSVQTEKVVRLEDEMSAEELERFRAELHASHEQALAGKLIPLEQILDEL